MSTFDKVLAACPNLKRQADGSYRGPSPLRAGSDSDAFKLTPTDDAGEYGMWHDKVTDVGGSLYDLAKALDIEVPTATKEGINSKRTYAGLDDYAKQHGVTGDVFRAAGWRDTTHEERVKLFKEHKISSAHAGRPAITYTTENGPRFRFLDGDKPYYIGPTGYKPCWYGLKRALIMAQESWANIVICNGEASVVVAQSFGVPAVAVTNGEKQLSDEHLKQLLDAYERDVFIAMDCDDTGRAAAKAIESQLKERGRVIDLQLDKGGDLADYCHLHGDQSFMGLYRKAPKKLPPVVSSRQIAIVEHDAILDNTPGDRSILFPFPRYYDIGGFAKFLSMKKVTLVIAPSSGGKTSCMETWADWWLGLGINGLWMGPEWSEREYHRRRVQRGGGPTVQDVKEHNMYHWYLQNKPQSPVIKQLKPLDAVQRRKFLDISAGVAGWPAEVLYFPPNATLETTLFEMSIQLQRQRDAGKLTDWAMFDYVQLLNLAEVQHGRDNGHEQALGAIKNWAMDNDIHAVVGAQINKTMTATMTNNALIKISDINYIRPDKANLVFALNTIYEEDYTTLDGNGDPMMKKTKNMLGVVLKNNEGEEGARELTSDFRRLRILDEAWDSKEIIMSKKRNDSARAELDMSNL